MYSIFLIMITASVHNTSIKQHKQNKKSCLSFQTSRQHIYHIDVVFDSFQNTETKNSLVWASFQKTHPSNDCCFIFISKDKQKNSLVCASFQTTDISNNSCFRFISNDRNKFCCCLWLFSDNRFIRMMLFLMHFRQQKLKFTC